MKYQVVDIRNNEVLFESDDKQLCIKFTDDIWEENTTDFIYAFIKKNIE